MRAASQLRSPVSSRDVIPIRVVRIDQDHGVVGGAPAQRAGARIEDAVARWHVVGVALLLAIVVIVPHEEIPLHGGVFGSESVEGGHIVIGGQAVLARSAMASPPDSLRGSPPASSSTTRRPASARRAATVPPPAPEPTTMYSQSGARWDPLHTDSVYRFYRQSVPRAARYSKTSSPVGS